jgi:flagellar basal body-associated protein FliL
MLGLRMNAPRRGRDEGEKPFWISFSDLMSALMVLFLVALSVALLAVTKEISQEEQEEQQRTQEISELVKEIEAIAKDLGGNVVGNTIDFGVKGRFEREGQNTLSASQRQVLMDFTPRLLERLRTPDGAKWFKRAVVEGYASQSGKYLFNLNLSLERSSRVLCELLREQPGGRALSEADRQLVATRFFVGGASFNSLQDTAELSRRIEFKLEFKTRQEFKNEEKSPPRAVDAKALAQALDVRERCPIQDR